MNKKNRISHILDSILVILFILLIVFIWFKNDEFLWLKIIVTAMSTITILFYIIIEHMINDDFENNQELIKLFMMKNDVTKSNKCTMGILVGMFVNKQFIWSVSTEHVYTSCTLILIDDK